MSSEPIFAHTRYQYDSYTDYVSLVALSDFKTCFVDEIDIREPKTYIVAPINGELRPHITYRREIHRRHPDFKLIWWNLERPDSGPHNDGGPLTVLRDELDFVDEVWVSDRYYASLDPRLKFVPLGSHPGLADPRRERLHHRDRPFDYAAMAAPVPRRAQIHFDLRTLSSAENGWGEKRADSLERSRIMLNVHQHNKPLPIAEPLRIALAAAYRMALVSEHLADPYPVVPGTDAVVVPYEQLAATVLALRKEPEKTMALGHNLWKRLCHLSQFGQNVLHALRSE